MDVASLTIDEFLDRLASSDPTPGGGSLAALAGAMAAAMLTMVCTFTIGRPRYADVESDVQDILRATQQLRQRLIGLANGDVSAYGAVRAAYGLPRSTDHERTARATAIEASMHDATTVPVETAEAARQVVDLALQAGRITNTQLLSDVAVGAHLALGALRGAADQASLNLASLKDADFVARMRARIGTATEGADAAVAQTLEAVASRSAGS
ncbi:MAG: methenyltetrahydrofolate cyclohydrolase [Chloroflexota bacterium]|jgi:formiminotetrahydrofolate cyclodeaminase|nr:methenyltetrahydrofolate cyclohydrolase [Chloroflexota bacterium]